MKAMIAILTACALVSCASTGIDLKHQNKGRA